MKRMKLLLMIPVIWLCLATAGFAHADANATASPAPASEKSQISKRDAVCTKCHDETETKPVLSIYQTKHGVQGDVRTPSCQSCHGESDDHVRNTAGAAIRPAPDVVFGTSKPAGSNFNRTEVQTQNKACLTCHDNNKRNMWMGSQHESRGLACASCHKLHTPRDPILNKATQPEVCFTCHKNERAQTKRISTHPLDAGKMGCTDCHNPHGSVGPKLLVKNSVNETCYTCHAEKRGPFLWEHQPVNDDCTNCHTPHGSNSSPLLKQRLPMLCQDCHAGDHAAAIRSGANLPNGAATTLDGMNGQTNNSPAAQANGRMCLNCHSMIHGSNHPAGAKLQR